MLLIALLELWRDSFGERQISIPTVRYLGGSRCHRILARNAGARRIARRIAQPRAPRRRWSYQTWVRRPRLRRRLHVPRAVTVGCFRAPRPSRWTTPAITLPRAATCAGSHYGL